MAGHDYLDFDLTFVADGPEFVVHASAPAGEAETPFTLPVTATELENFILRMQGARRTTRRLQSRRQEAAESLGRTLYSSLFTTELEELLLTSVQAARDQGAGLRIRLRLDDAQELVNVPWEYLHSERLGRPLSPSSETLLVRYREDDLPTWTLEVSPPLRVLVVGASPSDLEPLQIDTEMRRLEEAVTELTRDGRIEIHRLEHATLGRLRRRLRKGTFHILHFVGHGMFDEHSETGMLAFEDDQGRGRGVTGQQLGYLLQGRGLRMVVLNACEGARTGIVDPFGGVAHSLIRQGLSAVVAMQFEITDDSALAFSHEFYLAIADGMPVDEAMSEARTALLVDGDSAEWGIPVLHLRTPDGRVFDVVGEPTPPDPHEVMTTATRLHDRAEPAADTEAIGMLRRLLALQPDNQEAAALLSVLETARLDDERGVEEDVPDPVVDRPEVDTPPPAGPEVESTVETPPDDDSIVGRGGDADEGDDEQDDDLPAVLVPAGPTVDEDVVEPGASWIDRHGATLGAALVVAAVAVVAMLVWRPWDGVGPPTPRESTSASTPSSSPTTTPDPTPSPSTSPALSSADGLLATFAPVREGAWMVERGWRIPPGGDEFVGVARLSSPDGQALTDNHREVPPPAVAGDVTAIEWTPEPTATLESVGVFQNLRVDGPDEFIELEYRVPLDGQEVDVADMDAWFTEWQPIREEFMIGGGDELVEPIVTAATEDPT